MRTPLAVWFVCVYASVCIPPGVSSQQVTGQVLDPERVPISTAEIRFITEAGTVVLGMVSDRIGRFRANSIEAGHYWLMVRRIGYESTQIGPLALAEGDTVEVELVMAVDAIPLERITVTASARPWWEHLEPPALWEFWERKERSEKLGVGRFFTYEDLKPLGGSPAALAITDLAPFFFPESRSGVGTSFFIKGRTGCDPLVFLDGHMLRPIKVMKSGVEIIEPPVLDDYIPLSQIAAVEVYRGASDTPGEFSGFGSNCGAVAVWSLRGPPRR